MKKRKCSEAGKLVTFLAVIFLKALFQSENLDQTCMPPGVDVLLVSDDFGMREVIM